MHPFLRKRRLFLAYMFVWLDIGLLLGLLLAPMWGIPFTPALLFATPLTLAYGIVCLSAWWVCRSAPLGQAPGWRIVSSVFGGALQGAAVGVGLGALWGIVLLRTGWLQVERRELLMVLGALFVINILLYLMSIVVHYLVIAFEDSRTAERKALAAQVAVREAEVRALRAQLNPHFLFNSLNSINALIGSQPEDARHMCASLGDFLRQTLALGQRESVPLAEELALVERYLSIERVRFGDRLQVEQTSGAAAGRCLVPPLLLQPLVENAIKHGVADRLDGGRVRVDARRQDEDLVVTVENDLDEDAPRRRGEGVGLENVRRRLVAFAAREARLDVRRGDGTFTVTLRIPAREEPAAESEATRASA